MEETEAASVEPRPTPTDPAQTYDQYLGPAVFAPLSTVVLEHAAPTAGERVIDLACGTGIVTLQLARLVGETGKVVGVDVSAPMLAFASAKAPPPGCEIEWREGNASSLVDLDNGAFDLLICQQGMQFFPERQTAASEMRRVLTSEGRAVIACWQGLEHQALFQHLVETQSRVLRIPLEAVAVAYSLGDAATLETTLEDAGFERVEIFEHELTVQLPEPGELVRRTLITGAATKPQFASIDLDEATAEITKILAPVLLHYTKGDHVVFPMKTNIAIAKR